MGFFTRVGEFTRSAVSSVARGFTVPTSYGGDGAWLSNWASNNGPKEPFAGAWQRNLDNAIGAGPNLLANSTAFACISLISRDISCNALVVKRRLENGSREIHVNHPAMALFAKPNGYQTLLQFLQRYFISKLTHGNTYVVMFRDDRGVVNEMHVLNPAAVQVLIAEDGSVYYKLSANKLAGVQNDVTIPARDILHDRGVCFWHNLIGVSPMYAAAMDIMLSARMQINSERFFANMSRTSGVLQAPGKIEKEVAKRLQAEWEQNYSGSGIGRTAVLSNGLTYLPMTVNAHDAEVVQQIRWTVEQIARAFLVPTYKIGELSKASFKNNEQMARDYYDSCLRHYMESTEQCFERAFEVPYNIDIEFDLSQMFRMDSETRFTAHKLALDAGIKSINEVRSEEDLPPVPGGEEPRVQMQYVPLTYTQALLDAQLEAAKNPAAPAAAASSGKSLDDDTEAIPEIAPGLEDDKHSVSLGQLELDLLGEQFDSNFDLES